MTFSISPAGQDYFAIDTVITFEPGSVIECFTTFIIDDDIVEPLEEEFTVTIDEITADNLNPVLGQNPAANVTIVDDDGEFMIDGSRTT